MAVSGKDGPSVWEPGVWVLGVHRLMCAEPREQNLAPSGGGAGLIAKEGRADV